MARRIATFSLFCILVWLCASTPVAASQYHGEATYQGWPVPGATVTLTQGTKKVSTVTDQGGLFTFADLTDGPAKIEIEMQCFSSLAADVTIAPNMPVGKWELTLLPLDKLIAIARAKPAANPPPAQSSVATAKKPAPDSSNANLPEIPKPRQEESSDGFLVNGSVNNAATSKFSLDQAFGNRRPNSKSLYTGGVAGVFDNSAFDARPYSLSGIEPPKPFYNRVTGAFTFGGPLRIPHVWPHGPIFFVAYQWTRDQTAETESALVPTTAERMGDLSGLVNPLGQPVTVFNPATGLPFNGNVVPVSPQAQALLQLYPSPNINGNPLYNYQRAVLNNGHHDALQSRLDKTIGRKDELYGSFNFAGNRADNTNLFGFKDATEILGMNANVNWAHRFSQHLFIYASYHFSRLRTNVAPYLKISRMSRERREPDPIPPRRRPIPARRRRRSPMASARAVPPPVPPAPPPPRRPGASPSRSSSMPAPTATCSTRTPRTTTRPRTTASTSAAMCARPTMP